MASSWQGLASELSNLFQGSNLRSHTVQKFRSRHGPDGNGHGPDPIPYKFGRFVERFERRTPPGASAQEVLPDAHKARFLIDAGLRRWHPASIDNMENVIKHSLTRDNPMGQPDPKEIIFDVITDYAATLASADIYDVSTGPPSDTNRLSDTNPTTLNGVSKFHITIKCPP